MFLFRFMLSIAFSMGASYFLNKYGISIIKTPGDFIAIIILIGLSFSAWSVDFEDFE